jgi:hypothetical protein
VNQPGDWLKQVIELETGALGAKSVPEDRAPDADLVVAGTIRYLVVDCYAVYWANLVVDVVFQPKGKPAYTKTLHAEGKLSAWSQSSFEYYQPIRLAQQKWMLLLLPEIENALKG